MTFHCSWDVSVIVITAIYVLVIASVIFICIRILSSYMKKKKFLGIKIGISAMLFLSVISFTPAMLFPIKVTVDNEIIRIVRIYKDIVIPIENIETIKFPIGALANGSIRTLGSGGAFGYLGKFKNNQLGDYQMFVTDISTDFTFTKFCYSTIYRYFFKTLLATFCNLLIFRHIIKMCYVVEY